MFNINGKTALVTGGASGIGFETVMRLLKEGGRVAVWDASGPGIEKARNLLIDFKDRLLWRQVDISDKKAVGAEADFLRGTWESPQILINNAGVMRRGLYTEGSEADWQLTVDVNLGGTLHTISAFLPDMYARDEGHVVNVSSAAGMLGVSGLSVYAASKWAVHGLTDSLREEAYTKGSKVRFSSVHPFYITTGLFEGARIKGLGSILVPQVKNHDVIARAIVESALKRGKMKVYRPRSLFLIDLLKGFLPYPAFAAFVRWLRVQESMNYHKDNVEGDLK
jgi:all-trans-retinol dehydrogenase (NAD+)